MDNTKLLLVKQMIDAAQANLDAAKQALAELGITGGEITKVDRREYLKKAQELEKQVGEPNVIEGVFDGQGMLGPDKRAYPVPANYASKSKLVPGDVLKLTIKEDGTFIYKQIGPVDRARVIGTIGSADGQYSIVTPEGKAYKVLLASVTYFHAEVGDKVTLIIPAKGDSEWGSIENVLPKDS
jgi:hypothetical protein